MSRPLQSLTTIAVAFAFFSPFAVAQNTSDSLTTTGSYEAPGEYASKRTSLKPNHDGVFFAEAEEFLPAESPEPWRAQRWGQNYYAATFANCFLSRKAFLGASEASADATASLKITVANPGKFLALIRYEAAYRFETRFRLEIYQGENRVWSRSYGARSNLKIWPFGERLKTEVGWSWGAGENIVWEGHDAFVDLAAGEYELRLVTEAQTGLAARRNIDLVMLTPQLEAVAERIKTENYLPLDGLLTQQGDVYLEVTNVGDQPLVFTGVAAPGGGNWQEHSPYWVHQRTWKAPLIEVAPGQTSARLDVGDLMDSLNDGQWTWTGNGPYVARFFLRDANDEWVALGEFTGNGLLPLAADADTRYSHRLRHRNEVLKDLLAELKEVPADGLVAPQTTPIYALTFEPVGDPAYDAMVSEFLALYGIKTQDPASSNGFGMVDVRSIPTEKLSEYCQALGEAAKLVKFVSLGDEIALPEPSGADVDDRFRQWLAARGVAPEQVIPGAGQDASKVRYDISDEARRDRVEQYVWSSRYRSAFGIEAIKERTNLLRAGLPNATIGANYSPHYPQEHLFLGEVHKWVTVFREQGMTLPWSEDYIWQVPVGTPQMNQINLDLFRAATRHQAQRPVMYYVMPHMPNNTPRQWRRLFHGAVGHGMTSVNLFEFRPVHVAYTENHVDQPAMYVEVLKSFRQLSRYEDIVQTGTVREGSVGLWFSETADLWHDNAGAYAAAKRGLYTALRHLQLPVDMVVEQDALDSTLQKYQVLYLTDSHVSQAASEKIAAWVEAGGELIATAGAGLFDEFNRPNVRLRQIMGIDLRQLSAPADRQLIWIKQDLPFAQPLTHFKTAEGEAIDVFSVRAVLELRGAKAVLAFEDGTPALCEHGAGQGRARTFAFLPALSYYRPAINARPIDRGATDDSMTHFLPTNFDLRIARLLAPQREDLVRVVACSQPLVDATIIDSSHGVALPLVNWSPNPIEGLTVEVLGDWSGWSFTTASGIEVKVETLADRVHLQLNLDVAETLIGRKTP